MKKLFTLLVLGLLATSVAQAQRAPRGMNYQAVARNLSGDVMADQTITLRIALASRTNGAPTEQYSELHTVTTNNLGLFTLVIGEGQSERGTFAQVPWSSDDIWMDVSIREAGRSNFTLVSSSKLLAVPYAIHALTANEIVGAGRISGSEGRTGKTDPTGTEKTHDAVSGTSNFVPLPGQQTYTIPMVTESTSPSTGALVVRGGVGVAKNLNVGGNGDVNGNFNVDGNFSVGGSTTFTGPSSFGGKLNITDATQSTSITTGAITVAGGVGIGKNLNVGGNGDVDGTFNVDGATTIKNTLSVDQAVSLASTLSVVGLSTFTGAMTVNDKITSKTLLVSSDNANYLAEFVNTNGGDGDGLKIKLGKTHPAWNNGSYLNLTLPQLQVIDGALTQIKKWIYNEDSFTPGSFLNLTPAGLVAGTACALGNRLTQALNSALKLPLGLKVEIPAITIVPEIDLEIATIGPYGIPKTTIFDGTIIPAIPQVDCAALGFVDALVFPNISFTNVSNSLTKQNEFLSFQDKENRRLGAVRAQSVEDFSFSLDAVYLANFAASVISIDPVSIIVGFAKELINLSDAYNHIGVEYSSGNGDYAEWLERVNPNELISAGDIVGVRGGKITKDLAGAEQVMAVSHHPIVLGNMPPAGQESQGNQVAFMGQIPVKVMGAVQSGDYIVAKGAVAGYGVAVNPAHMTADDFRLVVGRSWEANALEGPKAVNTVVGVHNGDYLKLLKKQQDKLDGLEARLTSLEVRLNRATNAANNPAQREKRTVASTKK